jgi:nitroimidazol reductase NimA-like FMN-containing flavoprotein (pyridoxamine 5'-phosphate oxidase superfamily)
VICYGRARIIEDLEERKALLDAFNRCFQPDAAGISMDSTAKCGAVEIEIVEMTGRREREGERIYWRYRFEAG